MSANYVSAADVLAGWRDDVLSGRPPTLYPIAIAGDLARVEIGPGLVTLIGGAPGAGKTAFTMQAVVDALRLTEELRAVICNIEMPPAVLLDRQLARLSGIDLSSIRYRRLGKDHAPRIDQAMRTLEPLVERLCFVRSPYTLANVAATADAFNAGLIVLDYIQRIPPPGEHGDRRGSVDASMSYLREFADAGVAVMVIAALSRSKDARGRSTYDADSLSLASFRESSELEFGADDAFILVADPDDEGKVILRHLKSRYGDLRDIHLNFDRPRQRLSATTGDATPGKLQTALHQLWERSAPADDQEGGDE